MSDVAVRELLTLAADELIPPAGDWPAPSALDVVGDAWPRLRDSERVGLRAAATVLDEAGFGGLAPAERVEVLVRMQEDEPVVFALLRSVVYLAYYAQPAVVDCLRARGHDVNLTPQPHGYHLEPTRRSPSAGTVVWLGSAQVRRAETVR